ncbi:damage-inducible protein J [Aestuariibacter salexigens]|uniref:damage-inducible protein J n=1 Tax=Aestuariibacter salexigens TaxID=226010 RepID=UPI000411559B|nr:damage-inducible protein J [Aestuariibacter salexigens]
METRIQFRVDEETKRLAQQMAESQGRTLSDACRELTEQLADAQRKAQSHEIWLTEQVNEAFEKYDSGASVFIDNDTAKAQIERFKSSIRGKNSQ